MRIVRAIVYGSMTIFAISIMSLVLAGPVYDVIDAFDTVVSDINEPNINTFWGSYEPMFKLGFWLVGIFGVIGVLLWLYMKAQQREYVTGGRVVYR